MRTPVTPPSPLRHLARLIPLLVAAMLTLPAATAATPAKRQPSILTRAHSRQMDEWVNKTFASLSSRDRVAQLIVLTLDPKDDNATRKLIDKYAGECHLGGLLFSSGTMQAQAAITNYAQTQSPVPMLVTLDGEWGLSMRLKSAPLFPRNMVLGAITDERLLYEYGAEVARECKLMGIHVNFAPVLDVNDNARNPVIGTRSFGEVPERVARLGIAYAKGLEDNGVLATAKHFPGHGSSSSDSHKTLPVIRKSLHELNICELLPFRQYAGAGLSGVMVAHLNVPAIDPSGTPTSLSPKTGQLLRDGLGFQGLVFTDALTMKGASTNGSVCVKALLAGDDVLLSPANIESEIDKVLAAIATGRLPQSLVDEKCKKMLRYKYALGLGKTVADIDTATVAARVHTRRSDELIRRLWASAITVIKNKDKDLPVRHLEKKKIAVVTLGDSAGTRTMFQRRCAAYARTDRFSYCLGDNLPRMQKQLLEGHYDMVIVGVHSSAQGYSSVLSSLVSKLGNAVLAMMLDPYKVQRFAYAVKHSKAALIAYDNCATAQDYAAQTIFGGNASRGTLPVSIEGVAGAGTHSFYKAFRLGYTVPEAVGLRYSLLHNIDSIAGKGVKTGAFTACQVLVARHGQVICNRAYGYTSNKSDRQRVDENTIFDLASVSKATGTLAGIMKCYDQGRFSLDDPASRFITPLRGTPKEEITMRQLLLHESGMPASLNMYYVMYNPNSYRGSLITKKKNKLNTIKLWKNAYGNKGARLRTDILSTSATGDFNTEIARGLYGGTATTDSVMSLIYKVPLRKNKKCLYSCLNFCLLMDAEQRMTKTPHDRFVSRQVFAPLGAYHTCYRPTEQWPREDIAATEYDTFLRRQLLQGYSHDELAAFQCGVAGNAGLFSTANDLAKLFQMWLNGGEYGGIKFLNKSTVDLFLTEHSDKSRRGLGFDKPGTQRANYSPCSKEAPEEVVGHTGYTGTCFWVDPKNDLIYIFLSNRVCPTRDNRAFAQLNARAHIQSCIYRAIIE